MALNGKVGYDEISDLFTMVESAKMTGILTITSQSGSARLFFEWGELIRAESTHAPEMIGRLLVEFGALSASELDEALAVQLRERDEGGERRLGTILCSDFGVTDEEIQRVLALQFKTIVAEVLGWPGGHFRFESESGATGSDRFTLNASEYLIEVGIETGLLAKQTDGAS